MKIVDDRWYMPTHAQDAALTLWTLLDQGHVGGSLKDLPHRVYHVAGKDRVTLYQFVKTVAETWKLDPSLVEPCSFDDLPGLAPRPVDSSYRLGRLQEDGVIGWGCKGIREGLEAMRQEGETVFHAAGLQLATYRQRNKIGVGL